MSRVPDESGGTSGEDYHDLGGVEHEIQDMSVMLTITDEEGDASPDGCLIVPDIARFFQEKAAHLPYDVSVLNSRHALVDFERGDQS